MSKKPVPVVALDPIAYKEMKKQEELQASDAEPQQKGTLELLLKSLQNVQTKADRLSFDVDPNPTAITYAGLYRSKSHLTPDHIIKRVIGASGDDLVCQIVQARANIISTFGRPRMSRLSVGYILDPIPGVDLPEDDKEKEELRDRIEKAKKIIWNCGKGPAKGEYFQPNFSQYLKMITRDGVSFGRFATEILTVKEPGKDGEQFYGFRATDAGTIYHVTPSKEEDQSVRREAIYRLQQLRNERIDPSKFKEDRYKWVQVIEGIPRQAFSEQEMIVYNMYPTTNVEYNGYPLTPIDQALNAITTHISITMHNKLYFQNGRAARGMLVFKSDSVDESVVQKVRLQFHQSINSAANSWRMPVFGLGVEDELTWQSIDVSGRDAEFQYLMDQNARVILSAFQMSPEELPGYAHLARGTNTQALSESNNEWKLTAARDVGLRPLVSDIQDFLNTHILPLVDEELSKTHRIVLAGLESKDPEKESVQLQTDMNIHMTMNDVLKAVEKEQIPTELGGDLLLSQIFHSTVLAPFFTVGEIMENFMGRKGASKDPRFNYIRDPFYFQQQQLMEQRAQMMMQQQQQIMQQQMMAQQGIDPSQAQQGEGQDQPQGDEQGPPQEGIQKSGEVSNYLLLEKSSKVNARKISDMILARHRSMVDSHLENWGKNTQKAVSDISDIVAGKKKK